MFCSLSNGSLFVHIHVPNRGGKFVSVSAIPLCRLKCLLLTPNAGMADRARDVSRAIVSSVADWLLWLVVVKFLGTENEKKIRNIGVF